MTASKQDPERWGNRRVPRMYAQINALRRAIAAEGKSCRKLLTIQ
ncbi:hypothetical protein [Paracoccus aminophilus]|nr:hypothetical protein [Paracoccus aminophilus]